MTKSNRNFNPIGVGLTKTETIIGKMLCLLLVATVLSSCSAQKEERDWNDFYEVRTYDIHTEVITNEIITTVFIAKYAETNLYRIPQGTIVEAVGDSFEVSGYDYEASSGTPEFQCVDGSCEVKEK